MGISLEPRRRAAALLLLLLRRGATGGLAEAARGISLDPRRSAAALLLLRMGATGGIAEAAMGISLDPWRSAAALLLLRRGATGSNQGSTRYISCIGPPRCNRSWARQRIAIGGVGARSRKLGRVCAWSCGLNSPPRTTEKWTRLELWPQQSPENHGEVDALQLGQVTVRGSHCHHAWHQSLVAAVACPAVARLLIRLAQADVTRKDCQSRSPGRRS